MLTDKQYNQIREELDNCAKPLFFFHDDPDGLASFLLLYRYKKEGKGIPIKTTPKVDSKFISKVAEYEPDKVFIVDIAMVDQDFLDAMGMPVIWLDHHAPLEREKVKYFNPRLEKKSDNLPVSYICYNVVKQDMWISAIGCIGDWFFPPFAEEFRKEFYELLPENITKPEEALFNSKLGELVKIVSFILKGKISEVMKCVKILTRIESPWEILNQNTPRGKYLYKRSKVIEDDYKRVLNEALDSISEDDLFVFTYTHAKFSFSKELANELLYKFPDKRLIIGRVKGGEVKCSLRGTGLVLPPLVENALVGVEGYGGGHEYACGVCVKEDDFDRFVEQFKEQI